jgi:hypothetical protein
MEQSGQQMPNGIERIVCLRLHAKMPDIKLTAVQNHGLENVFIFCVDGLSGFFEAIETVEAAIYQTVSGYEHLMVNHSVSEFVNGMTSTHGIESIWD